MRPEKFSCWNVFRPVFVIFFLYLMGDAFYRWDGFRYYAPLSEFLVSLGLVSIIWSVIAGLLAIPLWLSLKALSLFYIQDKWSKSHHLIFAVYIFLSFGAIIYFTKRVIWVNAQIPPHVKGMLLVGIFLSTILLTVITGRSHWKNRIKVIQSLYTLFILSMIVWYGSNITRLYTLTTVSSRVLIMVSIIPLGLGLNWLIRNKFDIVQNRITPLVWMFGLFVLFSIPVVGYNTIGSRSDDLMPAPNSFFSEPEIKRPNILLVSFDALRTSAISVYGYERETTPFIDKWSKLATVFTRMEAESNNTYETTPSMMTGKRVWSHGLYHELGSIRNELEESFPKVLKENGYYNIAFIVNHRAAVKKLGVANSFHLAPPHTKFIESQSLLGGDHGYLNVVLFNFFHDKILLYDWIIKHDFPVGKILNYYNKDIINNPYPPEKAFGKFLELVDNFPKPYFAWIHLYPPHDPYLPPEPYMGMFDGSSSGRSLYTQAEESQPAPDKLRLLKSRYDEFIRYCDKTFEDLIRELKARDKLSDTIIILSSDHGESFEHGSFSHGDGHLYEQVTNIPFIIQEPGQSEGRMVNEFTEQVDMPATILDLVSIPVPSWMEGRSMVPLMRGKQIDPRPIFSMNLTKNLSRGNIITRGTIAVWEGDYKLIHYLDEDKSLLFNLKQDPGEMVNLVDRETEKAKHLLDLIKTNLEKANEGIRKTNPSG